MEIAGAKLVIKKRSKNNADKSVDKNLANKRARACITQAVSSVLSNVINRSNIIRYLDPQRVEAVNFELLFFLVDSNSTRYEDEDKYLRVRSKILEALERYKHYLTDWKTLLEKGLKKTDIKVWLYGPDCAQLVADTYNPPPPSSLSLPPSEAEGPSVNSALPLKLPKTKSKPVVNQTNLPTVYHRYFNNDGKPEEYESYWNKWHQFRNIFKNNTRPVTITIK
ncbi:hypothetical protein EDC96DRAFT_569935 [Choanephora cucurbitarum]|nr:hypothetical protein EDC96DRAFT_569935 [Choanephora cucurbitarum]